MWRLCQAAGETWPHKEPGHRYPEPAALLGASRFPGRMWVQMPWLRGTVELGSLPAHRVAVGVSERWLGDPQHSAWPTLSILGVLKVQT